MRFNQSPSAARSTVIDRLEAQRSAGRRDGEGASDDLLEHLIFTGRTTPREQAAPQRVKATPTKSAGAAPAKKEGESKLSPFEKELLSAWAED